MLGSDYRNQQVGGNNPNTCFNMCKRDSKCLAWTHVKPNIQGPKSVCWFKNVIPKPKTNNCCTSGWINPLYNFQACRSIGNTTGSRPATCIGEGGRNFGKAGKTFKKGDRVMLLTNFKRLPKGQKKLVFVYQKKKNGKFVNFSNNKKTVKFNNNGRSWSQWMGAHFTKSGSYRVRVALEGNGLLGQVLGSTTYCVDCTLE